MTELPTAIFQIAIETLFSASEPCGALGCFIYGMLYDDAAIEDDLKVAAHLPERVGVFGRPYG